MATRKKKQPETITIIGRMSTVYLARGQKATVTVTKDVEELLAKGYVEKVEE